MKDVDFKGKRVLMRVDVNVPLDRKGNVRDHQRIVQILPTINYILYKGAKQLILVSHHGRPHGTYDRRQSLQGVWRHFRDELAYDCHFVPDCISYSIPKKKLVLLENLRFHPGEEQNNQRFAKKLASYADIYVNDAFGSYQGHASIVDIPKYRPSFAGFLFQNELDALNFKNVKKPFVFLLGGDKASTKLPLIKKLSKKADKILVGGVLIFYFLKAMGYEIGRSKFNPEYVHLAKKLLKQKNIILPVDLVLAKKPSQGAKTRVAGIKDIKLDEMGLDIGPKTVKKYKGILSKAKTVVWNGPMGLYEVEKFAKNTDALANHLATIKGKVISGGGDSITVINKLGIYNDLDYVSTGGGATLKYIEKGTLPALEALKENAKRFTK